MVLEGLKFIVISMVMFLLFAVLSYLKDIDYKMQQYINYVFINVDNSMSGGAYES